MAAKIEHGTEWEAAESAPYSRMGHRKEAKSMRGAERNQFHIAEWRTVTTMTGAFHWGPERPSFANGAVVFLHPRDMQW